MILQRQQTAGMFFLLLMPWSTGGEGRLGGEGGEGRTEGRRIRTGVKIKFESATGTNPYSLLLSAPFPLTPIPPTVLSARGISVNLAF